MPNETRSWTEILAIIVELEHDVFNWDQILLTVGKGSPEMEVKHAEIARDRSMRRLVELRDLLAYYQLNSQPTKITVPMHVGAIVIALYAALMLSILLYLVVMAR